MGRSKVLIVGINSFVGKRLAKLLSDSHEVYGVYHKTLDADTSASYLTTVDDMEQWASLRPGFDIVYLISAYIPYQRSDNDTTLLLEANVQLVEWVCRLFGNAKLVYTSTVSVYEGIQDGRLIDESTPVSASTPYALSKLWGEQIVSKQRDFAILRLSSVYGAGMTPHTFIHRIIQQALDTGRITIFGRGDRLQNYIYVDDAANMLMQLSQKSVSGIYIGAGVRSYSNLEVAKAVQVQTGCGIDFMSDDRSASYQYDPRRIQHILGTSYTFKGLEEGIAEIIKWKQKQY